MDTYTRRYTFIFDRSVYVYVQVCVKGTGVYRGPTPSCSLTRVLMSLRTCLYVPILSRVYGHNTCKYEQVVSTRLPFSIPLPTRNNRKHIYGGHFGRTLRRQLMWDQRRVIRVKILCCKCLIYNLRPCKRRITTLFCRFHRSHQNRPNRNRFYCVGLVQVFFSSRITRIPSYSERNIV